MIDLKRLKEDVLLQAHDAVVALERFTETMHLAETAEQVAAAEEPRQIGQLYTAHLRCCWGEHLDQIARQRSRELLQQPMTPVNFDEPPF